MNIFKFSVGSEAKRVAVRCVFAIGVVCWANSSYELVFFCLPSASKHELCLPRTGRRKRTAWLVKRL